MEQTNPLKEQAKSLYETQSAKEIASLLGVSEPTVRRWVKGVRKIKPNQYEAIVDKLYTLATRPQGVRQKEEWEVYSSFYGNIVDEETGEKSPRIKEGQKSYVRTLVRTKAKNNSTEALFVPDWISPSSPRDSWNAMLAMTNEMYERIQEYVNGYMYDFDMPKDSRHAISQQLLVLLVPEYSPRNIYDVCQQATDVVDALERNKEATTHTVKPLPLEITKVFDSMTDIEQFIY